jgi:hypothetical protein
MTTPHGAHHDGRWTPASRLGAASLTLGGAAVAGLVLLAVAFALGMDHADSFTDSWLLLVWGLLILLSGLGAGVAGAWAIARDNERSWPVLAMTAVGVLVAAVVLREAAQGL